MELWPGSSLQSRCPRASGSEQNSPKMLADTKQAEPSRAKTHRARAIFLGYSRDEGVVAAACSRVLAREPL